jgi:DNA-binding winged helix-turn-helix (wHTH) protein
MESHVFFFGGCRLDPVQRKFWHDGKEVALTGTEFNVLLALVRHAGEPLEHDALLKEAWPVAVHRDNVKAQIKSLRRKLPDPKFIATVRNRGYQFAAHVAAATSEEAGPSPGGLSAGLVAGTECAETFELPLDRTERGTVRRYFGIAGLLILATTATMWFCPRAHPITSAPRPPTGRLLARSTSEGHSFQSIPIPHRAHLLGASPLGHSLFAAAFYGRQISIVDTNSKRLRKELDLSDGVHCLAVSADGKLYIGSISEGVMVFDSVTDRFLPRIETGGPVFDIAITPSGDRLYLAMGVLGLKRFSTASRQLVQLSNQACPENLALDPPAKHLYVAYQCGGPGGSALHDTIEIYDTDREVRVNAIQGMPLVGGPLSVAPGASMVL